MYFYNIKHCLKLLFLVGLHPEKGGNTFCWIMNSMAVFGGFSIIYLVLLELLYKEGNVTISDITEGFSSLSMLLHGLLRVITLYKKRLNLLDLLQRTVTHFWNIDDVHNREERLRYYKSLQESKNIFHYFAGLCFCTCVTFSLGTFVNQGNILPFECYRPQWISFYSLLLYQIVVNIISINIPIIGMDVLLMTCMSLARIQFAMLNEEIKRVFNDIEEENVYIRIKVRKLIKHHIFLLDYINRINNTFSTSLLVYMFIVVSSMCVEMYKISTYGTLEVYMKAATYISAALFNFVYFFCLPSQRLVDEANKISESIYLSQWIGIQDNLAEIIMIMASGQRQLYITAGGVFKIDLKTSLSAVKTMISYCTFLRTVNLEN